MERADRSDEEVQFIFMKIVIRLVSFSFSDLLVEVLTKEIEIKSFSNISLKVSGSFCSDLNFRFFDFSLVFLLWWKFDDKSFTQPSARLFLLRPEYQLQLALTEDEESSLYREMFLSVSGMQKEENLQDHSHFMTWKSQEANESSIQ